MGLAVGTHQTGPVNGKHHMVALDGNIVKQLVISPLQKSGINGANRQHPPGCQTGRHGHRMLFGDAHIKKALGVGFRKGIQAGSRCHSGGHGTNFLILCGQTAQFFSKNGRKIGLFLCKGLSGDAVKGRHAVEVGRRLLGGQKAPALLGLEMYHHRLVQLFGLLQQVTDRRRIVAVGRAEILKPHQLKQGLLEQCRAQLALAGRNHPDQPLAAGTFCQCRLGFFLHVEIPGLDTDGRQPLCQRTHIGADGHIVVIEHHDQRQTGLSGIVHGLIGHTAGERTVTDDADGAGIAARKLFGPGHAQRHRHRRGCVARNGTIIGTFGRAQKTADPTELPKGVKSILPPGEHLVHIALVSHVEKDIIFGRIKNTVQSDRDLHHAQIGCQMSAGFGHGFHQKLPNLAAQRRQRLFGYFFQVGGTVDIVQPGIVSHCPFPPVRLLD